MSSQYFGFFETAKVYLIQLKKQPSVGGRAFNTLLQCFENTIIYSKIHQYLDIGERYLSTNGLSTWFNQTKLQMLGNFQGKSGSGLSWGSGPGPDKNEHCCILNGLLGRYWFFRRSPGFNPIPKDIFTNIFIIVEKYFYYKFSFQISSWEPELYEAFF